jgi:dipeptidyl aminopeptidase/acylaminoacyl peptidase
MRGRLLAVMACGAAIASLGLGWTPGAGASRSAPAGTGSALKWQTLRVGAASDVLVLPAHPSALAVVLHGGEIAANHARAALSTRVSARVYAGRLAPLGIGVLSVNYRWSGYGGAELSDVEAALNRARSDPATAALPEILIGASHGGYLAALAATTPVARAAGVRAVVDLYGFSDLGATVTEPSSRYDPQSRLTIRELGPPAQNAGAYAARSPLSRERLLKAPIFQAVGGADRDTLPDVLALDRAIRARGGTAELHMIPGFPHGFAFGSSASPLVWREVAGFLERLGLTR